MSELDDTLTDLRQHPDYQALSPEKQAQWEENLRRKLSGIEATREMEKSQQPTMPEPTDTGSNETIKALSELGSMLLGGGVGGKVAREATKRVLPRIAAYLRTEPRLLGVTEPGMQQAGRLAGAGLGGGVGAVGGEMASQSRLNLGVPDIQSQFLRGTGEGLVGEAGGQLIQAGGNLALGKAGRVLTGGPAKPEDLAVANQAEGMGVVLRPSEVTANDVAAQIEQNTRRSLFGKGKFQERDIANEQAFRGAIEGYADRVFGQAKTPQETGRLVQDAIEGVAIPEFRLVQRGLYRSLRNDTNNEKIVDTKDILERARGLVGSINKEVFPKSAALAKEIEQQASQPGLVTGLKVRRKEEAVQLRDETDPAMALVPETETHLRGLSVEQTTGASRRPTRLDFLDAHDLRSKLLEITRTGEPLPGRVEGVAKALTKTIDEAMEKAATQYDRVNGTNVVQNWRVANASQEAGSTLFNSRLIKRALESNPEDVVKTVFQKDAQTETDLLMKALQNDQASLAIYRRSALEELLKRASGGGFLNGQSLYTAAIGKSGVGEAVLRKTFGEEHYDALKAFLEVGKRMNLATLPTNAGNPSQTGRTLINWFEQGMIIQLPVSVATNLALGNVLTALGDTLGTGFYMLSMHQLGKVLNSTTGLRLLREGMQMGPKSTNAGRVVSNLAAIAGAQDMHSSSAADEGTATSTTPPPTGLPRAFPLQP